MNECPERKRTVVSHGFVQLLQIGDERQRRFSQWFILSSPVSRDRLLHEKKRQVGTTHMKLNEKRVVWIINRRAEMAKENPLSLREDVVLIRPSNWIQIKKSSSVE